MAECDVSLSVLYRPPACLDMISHISPSFGRAWFQDCLSQPQNHFQTSTLHLPCSRGVNFSMYELEVLNTSGKTPHQTSHSKTNPPPFQATKPTMSPSRPTTHISPSTKLTDEKVNTNTSSKVKTKTNAQNSTSTSGTGYETGGESGYDADGDISDVQRTILRRTHRQKRKQERSVKKKVSGKERVEETQEVVKTSTSIADVVMEYLGF